MEKNNLKPTNWLNKPLSGIFKPNLETLIFFIIIALAIFSRLYNLGERVMSHDEINHVYFAWQFYDGTEYVHHPLSHGPFQFHLNAFFYFLFGDNDFTARLHAAVFSIATVIFLWNYRRYLGKTGTLATAVLYLISPFMLFYGRYARNDVIAVFFGLVTVWAVLRYLDTGKSRYLYIFSAACAFHFTVKETSFIFTAQLLVFLFFLFIYRISQKPWKELKLQIPFYVSIILFFITIIILTIFLMRNQSEIDLSSLPDFVKILSAVGVILIPITLVLLIFGFGWKNLCRERSFELILLQWTLIFPQLAALPIKGLGWDIFVDLQTRENVLRILSVILPMIAVSVVLGMLWKRREWLISAGIFYGIFIFFYSSVFTNMDGIYTGLVGSLGYWLEQQGVERGSQPLYYYLLVQIPIYEYLAAFGTLVTAGFGLRWIYRKTLVKDKEVIEHVETNEPDDLPKPKRTSKRITIVLGSYWVVTSALIYMVAGERMPWLTVHTSWAMLLVAGWAIGRLIDSINWQTFRDKQGLVAILLFTVLLASLGAVMVSFLKPVKPFQGQSLAELQATSNFLITLITSLVCIGLLIWLFWSWKFPQVIRVMTLAVCALLGVLTIRTSVLASFVNYDYGIEYLVYAHGAHGPKEIFEQIEDISIRTTGGKELMVAYDNFSAYPFWWYLRNYPNQLQFGETPSRELRNYPVILVGEGNYGKLEPLVGEAYIKFEYLRMVWPNQDYFNLDFYRNYLENPEKRGPMLNALFQIWLSRNFEPYSEVTGQNMSLQNWTPSNKMRMYIRKDIAAQIWEYGVSFSEFEITDPYEEKIIDLTPSITILEPGFNRPRDIAVAPDGTLYIADTENNRVVHLSIDGTVLDEWGTGGELDIDNQMKEGFFNQPWGITVDAEGYVYVADTWNHRIQKFTANGVFIKTWGEFGQGEDSKLMYGPRDVVIDSDGNLLVSDTGNKRILVFDSDGNFITQVGSGGYMLGQLDEPVGIAISPTTGWLYIADTWNQRVHVFEKIDEGQYVVISSWEISGWYGQSLDNKPYLTVDEYNRVFVSDPESSRILVFSTEGEFIGYWGSFESGVEGFGLVSGMAIDGQVGIWVTDGSKNRIQYFILPESDK